MNIVGIEQALTEIAQKPYNSKKLGLEFVRAFAKSSITVKRLKEKSFNASDIADGMLWRGYMHYAPASKGMAAKVLEQLKLSNASIKHKVRLLISTDGHELLVFDRKYSDLLPTTLSPDDLPKKPEFFFPLAGLESFKPNDENIIDIKATGKLAKLYDALIANNPRWESRRHELNHFMTQIIFCLFAEDTGIFPKDIFTKTLKNRAGNVGEYAKSVITAIFTILDKPKSNRHEFEAWTKEFPYVNGALFSGDIYVPKFDNKAFHLLLDAASLDWSYINPDILGSSIQAVVDPEMRGSLGMHYTSVQNILKTLSPLFLDELREELFKARYKKNKIHAFLERLSKIRIFDPACGSGNFLVIAYREMRKLEMEALDALMDIEKGASKTFGLMSRIRLSQFYGIEYADFAAETAKLALWIAEHQANSRFNTAFGMSQSALPLRESGNIKCANALRVDWNQFCPAGNSEVKICGNPPYLGSTLMDEEQKEDMKLAISGRVKAYKTLDYVCAWFVKGVDYCRNKNGVFAFVATNSIVLGSHVPTIWPVLFNEGMEINFAHTSFKWKNNAANNAGVTCVIIGMRNKCNYQKLIFESGEPRFVQNINGYLLEATNTVVNKVSKPINSLPPMDYGNKPADGGYLILSHNEVYEIENTYPESKKFIRRFIGSQELIRGIERYCLWIEDNFISEANNIPPIKQRLQKVAKYRAESAKQQTREIASKHHKFGEVRQHFSPMTIVIPSHSGENRKYLPVDILSKDEIISNSAFAIYDSPLYCFSLIASRMHLLWIATVCGKLGTSFRYSNTLGWHTFPIPVLTADNIKALEESTKKIIQARELHYPATIAQLYDPRKMPENLRQAHEENDRVLESLFRKKPFENDQDRLACLFKCYSDLLHKVR